MSTEKTEEVKTKAKRPRSPNYPFYSLNTCIEFLNKFVKNNKGFKKAHIDYATEYLGFAPNSARAIRAISAMLAYGLFDNEGTGTSRSFWPSELAKHIDQGGLDNADIGLIREAALNDQETEAVWLKWKNAMPGRGTLVSWLMSEREYSKRGAERFAYSVQETYDFAQLAELKQRDKLSRQDETSLVTSTHEEEKLSKDHASDIPISKTPPLGMVDYPIPLDGGKRFVYLRAPGDLTEADFDYIIQVIDVLKIGLAKKD